MADLKERIISFKKNYEDALTTVRGQLQQARQQLSQIQSYIKQKESEEVQAYGQLKALNEVLLDTPEEAPAESKNVVKLKREKKEEIIVDAEVITNE